MKVSVIGEAREAKHLKNLKLKLGRELPPEELEHCTTFTELEAKKKILEAMDSNTRHSRTHDERESLKFEEKAEGGFDVRESE